MHNLILKIVHFYHSFRKKEEMGGNRFHIYLKNPELSLLVSKTVLKAQISMIKGKERKHITSSPITSTPIKDFVQLEFQDQEKNLLESTWNIENITIISNQEIVFQYELYRPISISQEKQINYTWIVDNDWGGIGDGSIRSPYEVCSPIQLDRIRNYTNKRDIYFRQMCDIQLASALKISYSKVEKLFIPNQEGYIGDENGWIPIGSFNDIKENISFQGHYDGRGFKIDSLFINRPDRDILGLFGIIEGKSMRFPVQLSNIHIGNNSVINGQEYIGAIAGNAGYTNFLNCHNAGHISGTKSIGGLVGAALCTTISECDNQGFVQGSKDWGELVGRTVQASKKSH